MLNTQNLGAISSELHFFFQCCDYSAIRLELKSSKTLSHNTFGYCQRRERMYVQLFEFLEELEKTTILT